MIQKFLPIEMQLTYQVDGEPLERLPDGYSDHYVPDGFETVSYTHLDVYKRQDYRIPLLDIIYCLYVSSTLHWNHPFM